NDWTTRFRKVSILQNIGAGVAPWNHSQYSFARTNSKGVQVNRLPLVFYHFHSLGIIRPGIFIPAKHGCYPLPETSLRLCYLPYVESLDRAYESVRAILTDFDFGFDGEGNLSRDHTVIARREFRDYLQNLGTRQSVLQLNQVWDCRTSKQVQPSDRTSQV